MLPAFDPAWLTQSSGGRQIAIVVGLAAVAMIALLVAGAAVLREQHRPGRGIDDEELFTTTPLPMPKEELARLSRETPHHIFSGLRIPRWVQAGSLLAALGITYVVAQRLGPRDRAASERTRASREAPATERDVADDSPEDLDLTPESGAAFAFRVQDWVVRAGGGCAGRLEVTKGEPDAWTLKARVHDGNGQLIDTASARVSSLREGDVVEFTFPRADCDRIGAWDVRGARRR